MIRRHAIGVALCVLATLGVPLVAQGSAGDEGRLQIGLREPVDFRSVPDCPTLAAVYGVSLHGQSGSGENCIAAEESAPCPPAVTAHFCQTVPVAMTLRFPSGAIVGDVTIFEAWTCGEVCIVDQRWSGTVTTATRRFRDYVGGSVSGGGTFAFDATTFELVTFDEQLVVMKREHTTRLS